MEQESVELALPADEDESPVPDDRATAPYAPAHHEGGCACGGTGQVAAAPQYVYVLGQIDFRLPSLSVEKEIAQIVGRSQSAGLTDREAVAQAVAQPENRYLARQLCYVLSVQASRRICSGRATVVTSPCWWTRCARTRPRATSISSSGCAARSPRRTSATA